MLLLGTSSLPDDDPGGEPTAALPWALLGLPRGLLLPEHGVHRLGNQAVCDLVPVREHVGQRLFQALLNASPRHAVAPELFDEWPVGLERLDGRLFVGAEDVLFFIR